MKTLFAMSMMSGLMCLSQAAIAHTDLVGSTPANGAIIKESPEKMELHFTDGVRLLKFSITGSDGMSIQTEFKPSGDMLEHFEIKLPDLKGDSYTAHWSAMGKDSHVVEKSFAFTIDADAKQLEGASEPHAATHSH